jgi:arylsulfatase A-like enzyme
LKTFTGSLTGRSWFSLLALAAAAILLTLLAPLDRALAARPNFIVIQTDDQNAATVRAWMRSRVGGVHRVMPHSMRQFARGGTEFRNYYASSPVCSPSRASMLSGQYPWNNGVQGNSGPDGGWTGWKNHSIYRRNLATTLHRAGYRTAHVGKFTNGYYNKAKGQVEKDVPPGWDDWFTSSYVRGTHSYGYFLNWNGFTAGPIGDPNYRPEGPGIDPTSCRLNQLSDFWPLGSCRYSGDVFTAEATRVIRRNSQRPFFLQVDFQAPHGDVSGSRGPQPATRRIGEAADTMLPRPPSFNEQNFSDKPPLIRNLAPFPMGPAAIERLRGAYRLYLESLRSVDDSVGAIFRTLRKEHELRRTYVFLLSDHGLFLGEHRYDWGKFMPYEASSSPFMAVRGPGVPAGAVSREVVGNVDVPVTIMRLAHARPSYKVDGRSLRRYWKHPNRRSNRAFPITINSGEVGEASASISAHAPALRYSGYRVGRYKYTRYNRGGEELYDLKADPSELKNRIDSPGYADVVSYMRRHLRQVMGCSGGTCREELPPAP